MMTYRQALGAMAVAAAVLATPALAQAGEGCDSGVEAHVGFHVDTNVAIAALFTFLKAPSSAQTTLCADGSAVGGGMLTLVYDGDYVSPYFGENNYNLSDLLGIPYNGTVPLTVSFEPSGWKPDGADRYIIGAIARPIGRTRSLVQKNIDDPVLRDEVLNDWWVFLHVSLDTPPDSDGDGFPDYRVTISYPN